MKRLLTGAEETARSGARVAFSLARSLEAVPVALPDRPAEAWAGCPLHALYQALRRLGVVVGGAGCASPAAAGLAACGCGGTGAGAEMGADEAGDFPGRDGARRRRVVLLSADELADGGAAALAGAASAGADAIIVVEGARRQPSSALDPLALAQGQLAARWREIDVFDLAASAAAIAEEMKGPGPAMIVARGRCPLQAERPGATPAVVERRCNRCGTCLRLGCPAISEGEEAMAIDPSSCVGCGLCRQVCRAGAIVECADDGAPAHLQRIEGPRDGPLPVGLRCGEEGASGRGGDGPAGQRRAEDAAARGRTSRPATSIVLAGVLGQPVLATARLLARAAISAGLDASASEQTVPGSPGAITAHVRIREIARHGAGETAAGALSPRVNQGEADLLLGFEQMEALRAAPLLSPRAFVALCDRLIPTFRMRARLEPRPDDPVARLRVATPRIAVVPASALGGGRGLEVAAVLLGVVAELLPIPRWKLEAAVAGATRDEGASREAFARGHAMFERLPPDVREPLQAELPGYVER